MRRNYEVRTFGKVYKRKWDLKNDEGEIRITREWLYNV